MLRRTENRTDTETRLPFQAAGFLYQDGSVSEVSFLYVVILQKL